MKKLLAACTTALRALGLATGGSSTARHAHRHVYSAKPSGVRRTIGAGLAAILAVGMVSAAIVVPSASANNSVSDQNQPSYWQAQYPGSTCTKPVDELDSSSYVLPAPPSGTSYIAVIVKAGAPESVAVVNNIFDETHNTMPAPGVTVTSYSGKTISHIIVCTVKAPATTVTPANVTFAPAACTTPGNYGQGSYTIPATTGVQYQIETTSGAWEYISAGTYPANVGTTVTIRAVDASNDDNYTLKSGTWQWSQEIQAPDGSCDVAVTAGVTFTDAVCTAPGTSGSTGSYTIPNTTGVQYQIEKTFWLWFDNFTFWVNINAGTQVANVGTTVTIRAVAERNYTISGDAGPWTHVFVSAGACLTNAQPASVTFTEAVCTGPGTHGQASYAIPTTTGVDYEIDGAVVAAGVHYVAPGTSVTVTAVAQANYTLTGTTSWSYGFAAAGECLVPVTVTPATMVDNSCTTTASLTLPNITGVVWTVNGGTASAGTYPMNAGGPNTVVASAAAGYALTAPYSESFTFAPAVSCVTPVGPTFGDAVCDSTTGNVTGGYITIPATTGVSYFIDGLDAAAGPHTVSDGPHTVTALADAGYQLLGDTSSWPVTVTGAGVCHAPVSIETDPAAVQPQCVVGDGGSILASGYITVAVTDHVTYSITGTTDSNTAVNLPKVGAKTELLPGHYTVTAVADPGYTLSNGGPWNLTISAFTGNCQLQTFAPIPTNATGTNQVCTAGSASGGTITVGYVDEADFFNVGIDYFINGTKVTARTTTVPAGTYTVTAVADPASDASIQEGYPSEWTITVAAPSAECAQLKTLAFTGADGNVGTMMIIGLLLLLMGTGAYTASRLRSRES